MFPSGIFSIRHFNLHNFRVNGRSPTDTALHYIADNYSGKGMNGPQLYEQLVSTGAV